MDLLPLKLTRRIMIGIRFYNETENTADNFCRAIGVWAPYFFIRITFDYGQFGWGIGGQLRFFSKAKFRNSTVSWLAVYILNVNLQIGFYWRNN